IWRPRSPPLALISSAQICEPSSACWPLAASGPVSAMPKPILIGAAPCAKACVRARAGETSAAARPALTPRRDIPSFIGFPPECSFLRLPVGPPFVRLTRLRQALGAFFRIPAGKRRVGRPYLSERFGVRVNDLTGLLVRRREHVLV